MFYVYTIKSEKEIGRLKKMILNILGISIANKGNCFSPFDDCESDKCIGTSCIFCETSETI